MNILADIIGLKSLTVNGDVYPEGSACLHLMVKSVSSRRSPDGKTSKTTQGVLEQIEKLVPDARSTILSYHTRGRAVDQPGIDLCAPENHPALDPRAQKLMAELGAFPPGAELPEDAANLIPHESPYASALFDLIHNGKEAIIARLPSEFCSVDALTSTREWNGSNVTIGCSPVTALAVLGALDCLPTQCLKDQNIAEKILTPGVPYSWDEHTYRIVSPAHLACKLGYIDNLPSEVICNPKIMLDRALHHMESNNIEDMLDAPGTLATPIHYLYVSDYGDNYAHIEVDSLRKATAHISKLAEAPDFVLPPEIADAFLDVYVYDAITTSFPEGTSIHKTSGVTMGDKDHMAEVVLRAAGFSDAEIKDKVESIHETINEAVRTGNYKEAYNDVHISKTPEIEM